MASAGTVQYRVSKVSLLNQVEVGKDVNSLGSSLSGGLSEGSW